MVTVKDKTEWKEHAIIFHFLKKMQKLILAPPNIKIIKMSIDIYIYINIWLEWGEKSFTSRIYLFQDNLLTFGHL